MTPVFPPFLGEKTPDLKIHETGTKKPCKRPKVESPSQSCTFIDNTLRHCSPPDEYRISKSNSQVK